MSLQHMYQRRAKRVAGPGFHVNVKMDQFQIATMRGRNGDVRQSSLIPSSSQPEIYDIKEQEILVAKKTSGSMYHDGYTHVFSVVNGYDVGPNAFDAQTIKDKILNEVRFVGIATTEQKADDKLIDQGCVATVGGVVTVLNNGTEPIHPTQKVKLDINLSPSRASITREKGIPRQKVRFSFAPADDDLTLIGKALNMCQAIDLNPLDDQKKLNRQLQKDNMKDYKEKVEAAKKEVREAEEEVAKERKDGKNDKDSPGRVRRKEAHKALAEAQRNLKDCKDMIGADSDGNRKAMSDTDLQQFLQNYRHLNERVIGKAMSYAAPGDRFEILLQPRHSL